MAADDVLVRYQALTKQYLTDVDKVIKANDEVGTSAVDGNKKAQKSMDSTAKNAKGLGDQFKQLRNQIIGAFSIGLLVNFAKEVARTASQFQKLGAVLENTLGSKSRAQIAFNNIQKFASRTNFSVGELTDSFVKLSNQGFTPTISELENLADLANSTGKTFDQLTEAIIDAQVGEFERLKEFGIRAQKEGDNVTFTFKGVQTQVDFTNDSIRGYILGLGDLQGVTGSTAKISKTLGGAISNFGDAYENFLSSLGESDAVLGSVLSNVVKLGTGFFQLITPTREFSDLLQDQQVALNLLVTEITNTNLAEEERAELINQLNQEYPEFNKFQLTEASTNEQIAKALKEVNKEFVNRIILQTQRERIEAAAIDVAERTTVVLEQEQAILARGLKIAAEQGRVDELQNKSREEQIKVAQELITENTTLANSFGGLSSESNRLQIARDRLNETTDEFNKIQSDSKLITDALNLSTEEQGKLIKQNADAQIITNEQVSEQKKKISKEELKRQQKLTADLIKLEQELTEESIKELEEAENAEFNSFVRKEEFKDEFFDNLVERGEKALDLILAEVEATEEAEFLKTQAVREAEDERRSIREERIFQASDAANQLLAIGIAFTDAQLANDELAEVKRQRLLERRKKLAIAQATISALLASAQVFANTPGELYIKAIFAALALAAGLATVAKIKNTPAFAEGTDYVQLNGNPKGKDTIHARLDEGEAVIKASENNPAISRAYNDGRIGEHFWVSQTLPALQEQRRKFQENKDITFADNIANSMALNFHDGNIVRAMQKNTKVSKQNTDRLEKILKPQYKTTI